MPMTLTKIFEATDYTLFFALKRKLVGAGDLNYLCTSFNVAVDGVSRLHLDLHKPAASSKDTTQKWGDLDQLYKTGWSPVES